MVESNKEPKQSFRVERTVEQLIKELIEVQALSALQRDERDGVVAVQTPKRANPDPVLRR
jgi:hypothetical protein